MSILTNVDRYGKMVEALNNFYWDNSISPNETAARLDEFAAEVSRLAKFIRDNDPALDRAAELPLERTIQALEALCKLRDELRKSDYANWCGRVEMVIGLLDNA